MGITQIYPARTCGQGIIYFVLLIGEPRRSKQISSEKSRRTAAERKSKAQYSKKPYRKSRYFDGA